MHGVSTREFSLMIFCFPFETGWLRSNTAGGIDHQVPLQGMIEMHICLESFQLQNWSHLGFREEGWRQ